MLLITVWLCKLKLNVYPGKVEGTFLSQHRAVPHLLDVLTLKQPAAD